MPKTRRELVDRALDVLGVLASGQVPEVEDVARLDGYVETTIEDLLERDIIDIPDPEEIELSIFDDLAKVLANNAREGFGLANDPRLAATAQAAEKRLLEKSWIAPTYKPLKTQYF